MENVMIAIGVMTCFVAGIFIVAASIQSVVNEKEIQKLENRVKNLENNSN